MLSRGRGLAADRRGVTSLEYGIIAAMLAFVIIAIFTRLGTVLYTVGGRIFVAL